MTSKIWLDNYHVTHIRVLASEYIGHVKQLNLCTLNSMPADNVGIKDLKIKMYT